jgi:hypothetical protein
MSFASRVSGIATGFYTLGSEIVETGWDTIRSVFTPDEYEGVGDTIVGIIQDNLISGVMGSAFGQGSALEQTVGAIPEKARAPISTFTNEVLGRVDTFQDAYIERPLSAAVMGYHLATQSGLTGWADTDTYRTAWKIASDGVPLEDYDRSLIPENQLELFDKGLSLGRAVAFATLGTDVLNPQVAAEAAQSSAFTLISGAVDFGETILLDPLLLVGKPLQAARAGKLTVTAGKSANPIANKVGTDVAAKLRRKRRGNVSPTRSLTVRKGGKYGLTNKLEPGDIANFTTRRAEQVVTHPNWTKLNAAIDALPSSSFVAETAFRSAKEIDRLTSQRATEIKKLTNGKIDDSTAYALAQAKNQTMRTNHYKYMMGDQTALGEAMEAAQRQADRAANLPEWRLNKLKKNEEELASITARVQAKLKAAKEKEDGGVSFSEVEAQDIKLLDAKRQEVDNQRFGLKETVQGQEEWDFGFVLDLKLKFDFNQIDNLAPTSLIGTSDNALSRFFALNDPRTAALLNEALDSWMFDAIDFGDIARIADDPIELAMRQKSEIDRQIMAPLSIRATSSPVGVAAKVFESASKGVTGTRIVQMFVENTAQRFMLADDIKQSTNQFDRVIRDAQRMEWNGKSVLSEAEADRLLGDWTMLKDADARLAMFQKVTERINKNIADAVFPDSVNAAKELQEVLSKSLTAAQSTLQNGKPLGGLFGSNDRTRLNIVDEAGATTDLFSLPMNQKQLASSLIVPRYDLIQDALRKHSKSVKRPNLDKALDIPRAVTGLGSDISTALMSAWRPAVLLRPAWPLRVVGDEALRVASVVGAIPQLGAMIRGSADFRVALLKRRGVDTEAKSLAKMREKLKESDPDFPDKLSDFEVYERYLEKYDEKSIEKLFKKTIDEEYSRSRKVVGIAARGFLGMGLLGPAGAVGAALGGMATQSRTARRLAQRNIGEAFAQDLKTRAGNALAEAQEEIAKNLGPAGTAKILELEHTAKLLYAREVHIKKVLKKYGYTKDSLEGKALTTADAAGRKLEQAGRQPTMIAGVLVREALGEDDIPREVLNARVSADRSSSALLKGSATKTRTSMKTEAEWRSFQEREPDFANKWGTTTNRQWKVEGDPQSANNQYLEKLWSNEHLNEGAHTQSLLEFFDTSAGRQVLDALQNGTSPDDINSLVQAALGTVNGILPRYLDDGKKAINNFDELRARMATPDGSSAGKNVTWDEASAARSTLSKVDQGKVNAPDIDMGTTVGQTQGLSTKPSSTGRLQEFTQGAFNVLATLPTDHLSRLPYFRASFETEMARTLTQYLIPGTNDYRLQGEDLQKIVNKLESNARDKALADVRYLLYDLTESTRMQEVLSNFMPFLGAWQEVISRWGNIARENPAYVARVLDNFNSIPITEDEETGARWMVLRVPEMEGFSGFLTKPFIGHQLKFSQDAMSMLSSGGPGFGPLVTIPITEIAVVEPTLEEAMEFMWPYGLPQGDSAAKRIAGQLGPAWMKRAKGAAIGSDEQERIVLNLARDHMVRLRDEPAVNDGDIQYPNRYAEMLGTPLLQNQMMQNIRDEARSLLAARAFASMVLPTSMLVESPYQFYIDQYRAFREADYSTADDRFVEDNGAEMFAVMQRTTSNGNGVAPTIESWETFQEYRPLIESYPMIGRLITGSVGSLEVQRFNEAVYRRQQSEAISPGSATKQRQRVPLEDFVEGPDIKEGWAAYRTLIDVRNKELMARREQGASPSINAKSNEKLKSLYQWELSQLETLHPAWWREFNVRDNLKDKTKFEALRAVASDETLLQREDIKTLKSYLQDRQTISKELEARRRTGGSASLSSTKNQDLAEMWEFIRMDYRENIPEFQDIFDHYLNLDAVDETTWRTN